MKKQIIALITIAFLLSPQATTCCPTCVARNNPEKYSTAFFKRNAYTRYQKGVEVEKAASVDEMLTKMRLQVAKKEAR